MRRTFASTLYREMESNDKIWLVTADLGFGVLNKIADVYPNRFINCGAAEQAGVDLCVGLALSGKIPFFYSITPFALYRPFESIRNYLNTEKIPVKIVGTGRGRDYDHLGFTHWSEEDEEIMAHFKNIVSKRPQSKDEVVDFTVEAITTAKPFYINLPRV